MTKFAIVARRGDGSLEVQYGLYDSVAEALKEAEYRRREMRGVEFLVARAEIDIASAKLVGER